MSDFAAIRRSMVEGQVRTNDVQDRAIVAAMRDVPRELFVPAEMAASAYADLHVPLGEGRVLLRPRDFAKLLQALEITPLDRVLDIACGSGYSAAVLARLAGSVVAIDDDPRLASLARQSLTASGPADGGVADVTVIPASLKAGAAAEGPYDVIVVNGCVAEPAQAWLDQLADGGRLGVFERARGAGKAVLYRRDGGVTARRELFDADVPMLPGFTPQPEFVF